MGNSLCKMTMTGLKRVANVMPVIEKPKGRRLTLKEKSVYTGASLLVFLACSRMPLYGISKMGGIDSFSRLRAILLSSKGSLMELGIQPMMNASLIFQILSAMVKFNKEDRQKLQRLLCVALTLVQAVLGAFVMDYRGLPFPGSLFIAIQLFTGGLIAMSLDEVLENYGLVEGMGSSLFSAVAVSEGIIWHLLSPTTAGNEFEGALVALVHKGLFSNNRLYYIKQAFFRGYLPNLMSFLWTLAMFSVVIYLQAFQLTIPMVNRQGQRISYPVKLFYTSSTPIMIISTVIANLGFFARILGSTWAGRSLGYIVYLLMPPASLLSFHALFYVFFTIVSCTMFAKYWGEVGGGSSKEIAEEIKEKGLTIVGHRQSSTKSALNRYLPKTATLSGFSMGSLEVLSTLCGSIVQGTGILLIVNVVSQLHQTVSNDLLPMLSFGR